MESPDMPARVPVMLSIAGSDPSGGAGIQADLKTATALGVYGAAVITSLTAQNTKGVSTIRSLPASFVTEQYVSVVEDLDVRAIKIGMLGSAGIVEAVADAISSYPVPDVVLDPVMVATSGNHLVSDDTMTAIRTHLLPLVTLITPNLPEVAALLGGPVPHDESTMADAALALREAGVGAALVKGGHLTGGTSDDVLADAEGLAVFRSNRVDTTSTHGTGCTLSSAIASYLVYPLPLRQAIERAKTWLTGALLAASWRRVGSGNDPVDHLWRCRDGGLDG